MLRLGIISEIGEGENLGYARVSFDENEIVSGWLAMPSMSTKSTKHWVPVEVNAQVACLMDQRCEQGAIVLVLWSNTDVPPEWAGPDTMGLQFADGTEIFYNAETHKLAVNAPDAELTIKCVKLNVEGEVNIKGDTNIAGEVDITGDTNITGDANVMGEVVASDEVTAGPLKIKLTTHTHPTAVGPSGVPIP